MVTPDYLLLNCMPSAVVHNQFKQACKEHTKMVVVDKENWIEPKELKIKKVQEWNIEKHAYETWYELYGIFDLRDRSDGLLGCRCWKSLHDMQFDNDPSFITQFETVDEAIETYKQCHEDMFEHPRKEEFIDINV